MKKFTAFVLILVLCAGVLAGCRRGRVDNTSEPTLLPTTSMTEGTISPSTMDTTPNTIAPETTYGTTPHGTDHGTEGTRDSGITESTTLPRERTGAKRPY